MDAADSTQRAAVESLAAQLAVNEIDQSGKVVLEPELSVQDMMTRQIGQLWEQHANFDGISDTDSDTMSITGDEEKAVAADKEGDATMDAYAVRATVHEHLRVAQSEIQVSLDMVRLLLAAKKRAAREAAVQLQDGAQLAQHGQEQRQKELGFAARVGDVEVTVGGTPFPIDILGAVRVDAAHATNQVQQQQRREDELRFVLGAKHKQLTEAADTLERSAQRLKKMVRGEARFWRTAFELRRRNWVVLHQSQVPGMQRAFGDRYFVRFGYADAGLPFADDAVAELLRSDDDLLDEDAMDVDGAEPTPVFIPKTDDRAIAVSLAVASQGRQSSVLGFSTASAAHVEGHTAYDRLHQRLLRARSGLFDRELFHRLCREARVLELGSVRTVAPNTDVLMVALSRDNVGVRFEWSLQEPGLAQETRFDEKSQFAQWQGEFYAGMARVMVGMSQRRAHAASKSFQLGDGLLSRALLANGVSRSRVAPEAFASTIDDSASSEASAIVSRADLLILSPALQGAQFAKWQHVLSASVQRACAAWRRLVDEPIEVISHLARTHRIPANQTKAQGTQTEHLVYMVRMRFQGGTVMEFWLATIGRMYFVKGYYPPMAKLAQTSPEQTLIRRVFRVVPMSSLNEFCDQLRRELQSLVLLRVAAALTRSDQALARRGWRVGQCHVHQSQMCVVGELWQDARQRQIIGIAKWDASSSSDSALAGLGDEEWNLTLYFGPKHPTTFDIPHNAKGPWVTCFPPTQKVPARKKFEEQLLDTLLSAL
ncbi:hypothetical protein GGH96_003301 [Coemansia sp. RSA 1972]|nr:hypothetical protein GGH96_003301 [Coemansia sp. RSA 1972]